MADDLLTTLEKGTVEACAAALHRLIRRPDASLEVRRRLEHLLGDRRCTALKGPHLGELRLLAGHAYARLLASEGDRRVVRIAASAGLYRIEELNEITLGTQGSQTAAEFFCTLRDMSALPLRDYFFDPAQVTEEFNLESAPLQQAIYEAAAAGVDGHLIQIIPGPLAVEP